MVAFLLAGGACADDVPGLTTTSDTEPGTSTSDGPTTGLTTIDPDSTGGSTMGMDSGDTTEGPTTDAPTTDAPTTDATTTDGGDECGNGMAEASEECDGEDLDGQDCESQGFMDGALMCNADCSFDTSGCTKAPECGNGAVDGMEDCDGMDLGGGTCQTEGFGGGRLACADDCTYDTTACMDAPSCGNGAIDGMEACDGADLGGEDCVSQGFAGGGVLACAGDCTFDTAACMAGGMCAHDICATGVALDAACDPCVTDICAADAFCCDTQWDAQCVGEVASICGIMCPGPMCGNDLTEPPEVCDGTDLGGEDCVSQGFAGGVLACAGDCSGFDTAGCMGGGMCAHDICDTGAALDAGCDPCVTQICAVDAFCCDTQWDAQCVGEVTSICGLMCAGAVCGDAVAEAPEACDGADLAGETCVSQGFMGGVLACAADCATFNTAGCMGGGAGDCCAAHMTPGCQNAACEAAICAADAFCCDNQWDGACANAADINPACVGAGGTCPAAAVCGDAAITAPEVCDGANLNGQTCASQGFMGGVLACAAGCNAFNTAGCMGMGVFACQDQDIASAIGAAVAMGTTVGADDDVNKTCGGTDGNDQVIRFVAPAAGQYTINTNGSAYDTVLALFSDCATQLACDDDGGVGTQSLLVTNLAAGQVILIAVDGFNGATGNWTLNITSP